MSGFIVVNIYVVWAHKLMRFWSRLLRHQLRTSPFLSEIVFSLETHHPNQSPQWRTRGETPASWGLGVLLPAPAPRSSLGTVTAAFTGEKLRHREARRRPEGAGQGSPRIAWMKSSPLPLAAGPQDGAQR